MSQKLDDPDEYLWRQVHPSWVGDDGHPSSQAFKPTPKDQGMLSIGVGGKISAEGAYVHHTQKLGHKSQGSWAVTSGEARAVALDCYEQPLDDTPHHGFVDFRGLPRKASEANAKVLLASARDRGRVYPE